MKKLTIFFIICFIINIVCKKGGCKHNNQDWENDKCRKAGSKMGKKIKEDIETFLKKCNENPDRYTCLEFCRAFKKKLLENINMEEIHICLPLIEDYFRNPSEFQIKVMVMDLIKKLPEKVEIRPDSEFYNYFEEIMKNKSLRRLDSFIERSLPCEYIIGFFGFDTDDCFD